jgi:hypothetical protein
VSVRYRGSLANARNVADMEQRTVISSLHGDTRAKLRTWVDFCEVLRADKINVSVLDIGPCKCRPKLISDVQPLVSLRQQPFNRRLHDPNKSPVRSHARAVILM